LFDPLLDLLHQIIHLVQAGAHLDGRIEQDKREKTEEENKKNEDKMPFWKCFSYKQTWAFAVGKFMTDGVWWFFLFWTPSYLNMQFNIKTSEGLGMALIFTLYAIVTVLSIFGGKLPTIFINRSGQNPYAARMKAMLIFAFFPDQPGWNLLLVQARGCKPQLRKRKPRQERADGVECLHRDRYQSVISLYLGTRAFMMHHPIR
jgi:hypothetical protein